HYLLTAPDYQPMWSGEVIIHLITAICHFLKPSQYALVRALSLFHEPVPLDGLKMTIMGNSASHATGTEYLADLEKNLDILIQLAIVQQVVNVEGHACYELHALLRLYIQEHYLQGSDLAGMQIPARPASQNVDPRQVALAAGYMQVASYYLSLRKTRCPPPGERKGPQDVAPIIAAIRHLCLGRRWQRACELLFEEGLHHSMIQWGAWNTLIGLYTALLPPLGVLLRRDEGVIAGQVGLLYGRMGERQQSQTYFERALAIQRQIDDTKGEITTLINQGELLRMYGDTEKARENFERALALNEQLTSPDMYCKCILLHNLGLVHHSEKRQKEAFRCYIEALQLTKGERGEQNVGMILTNLGILMYEQGVHREALAILLAAQQLRERRQDAGVSMLEHFLNVLEQGMGGEAYAKMRQEALAIQQEVLSRFISINVRQ
ncbi:MAG: tetratricopeptide repeat protein, partial [Ktedonobacteraceae bacterium]|nr:tetratricopeptide repeat protein [Ktedonobacteraceae bacterium]